MIIDTTQSKMEKEMRTLATPLGAQTLYYQMLMQLHAKRVISTEALLSEMGLA